MVKLKILLINDIHYCESKKYDKKQYGITYRDLYINNLIEEVYKEHVDLIVNTGDIVHDVNKLSINEISNILNVIQSTDIPQVIISGNHDRNIYNTEHGSFVSLFHKKSIRKVINESLIIDDMVFVPFMKSKELIAELERLYNELKGKDMLMFGHFGLDFAIPGFSDDILPYIEVKEFLSIYRQVYLGHLHLISSKDNVKYTGSLTTHNFSDRYVNGKFLNKSGYTIIDTDTLDERFIQTNDKLPIFIENPDISELESDKYYYVITDNADKYKLSNVLYVNVKKDIVINKNEVKYELDKIHISDDIISVFIEQGINEFEDKETAMNIINYIRYQYTDT